MSMNVDMVRYSLSQARLIYELISFYGEYMPVIVPNNRLYYCIFQVQYLSLFSLNAVFITVLLR